MPLPSLYGDRHKPLKTCCTTKLTFCRCAMIDGTRGELSILYRKTSFKISFLIPYRRLVNRNTGMFKQSPLAWLRYFSCEFNHEKQGYIIQWLYVIAFSISNLSSLHDHKLYMFYSTSVLIKHRSRLCREVPARYLVKKCGALTTLYLAFSSGRAHKMQNVKNLHYIFTFCIHFNSFILEKGHYLSVTTSTATLSYLHNSYE